MGGDTVCNDTYVSVEMYVVVRIEVGIVNIGMIVFWKMVE